jgi:hypothetical protein
MASNEAKFMVLLLILNLVVLGTTAMIFFRSVALYKHCVADPYTYAADQIEKANKVPVTCSCILNKPNMATLMFNSTSRWYSGGSFQQINPDHMEDLNNLFIYND